MKERIDAVNKMADAGYLVGILIAPIILLDNYKKIYADLIETMAKVLKRKNNINNKYNIKK